MTATQQVAIPSAVARPWGRRPRGRHVRSTPPRTRAVGLEDVLSLAPDRSTARRGVVHGVLTGTVLVSALCTVGILLLLASGGRWFTVETPSMGTAAPVGALVVTEPPGDRTVQRGDVVTFRPAGSDTTWTHRVVRVGADGAFRTRGDVNGALDPWVLTSDAVVGRVTVVLPVVGWLLRAVPLLTLGALCVWAVTGPVHDRALRGALRVFGSTVVLSAVVAVLRPLVDVRMLSSAPVEDGATAVFVSAGLLPTRVTAPGGASRVLSSGEVGRLTVETAEGGRIALDSAVHLDVVGWLVLATVCCIPVVVCGALERSRPRLT